VNAKSNSQCYSQLLFAITEKGVRKCSSFEGSLLPLIEAYRKEKGNKLVAHLLVAIEASPTCGKKGERTGTSQKHLISLNQSQTPKLALVAEMRRKTFKNERH